MTEKEASAIIEELYDSHYSMLITYAARQAGCAGTAEDAVQEAFMQLYRELREGRPIGNPAGWLVCVTRRLAYQSALRHNRLEPLAERHLAPEEPGGAGPDIDCLRLRDLLSELSEREAEVLVMRLSAMKYREIAEQLNITTSSVNTLLLRALKKLKRAMKESTFDLKRIMRAGDGLSNTLQ
jgi:RNA polymerase sigma-70 factor, ECF subfamily